MPSDSKKTSPEINSRGRFAIVIPVFNHGPLIGAVVDKAQRLGLPVIVVDDGSTDSGCDHLKDIGGVDLLQHKQNKGKGAALITGFKWASEIADWAITIDADGQHHPRDALEMINAIPEDARPIVVGLRQGMAGAAVPWTSRFGRKFSNFWVRLSGGPKMADSQSGFRIYPLPECLNLDVKARRFQFEVEILVRAVWVDIPVIEVPVQVSYAPGQRISHFRPWVDFWRNTCTFYRLITRRLLVHPFKRKRKLPG